MENIVFDRVLDNGLYYELISGLSSELDKLSKELRVAFDNQLEYDLCGEIWGGLDNEL